jgi:dihydroxyacid dehydratase/phosphogluconate dehydratase
VSRLVSVLPKGPVPHPTVRGFLAGEVAEVMPHLRDGVLRAGVRTVAGTSLDEQLDH